MHPHYVATADDWALVRLARLWRDGVLPEPGGLLDQAAWTVAAVGVVLRAWDKLLEAQRKKKGD